MINLNTRTRPTRRQVQPRVRWTTSLPFDDFTAAARAGQHHREWTRTHQPKRPGSVPRAIGAGSAIGECDTASDFDTPSTWMRSVTHAPPITGQLERAHRLIRCSDLYDSTPVGPPGWGRSLMKCPWPQARVKPAHLSTRTWEEKNRWRADLKVDVAGFRLPPSSFLLQCNTRFHNGQ